MQLWKVPNKTWIKFQDQLFHFDHIDGMYSLCTDKDGQFVHLACWCDVELAYPKDKEDV